MKQYAIMIIAAVMCLNGAAQHRLVADVKKSIDALTMTVDKYKNAYKKLQPALTHPETAEKAETWTVAGRILMGQYDKCVDNRRAGMKVNGKEMAYALLDGYDALNKALSLDTIVETDKNGNPRIDKKTGKVKIKTKYSRDIRARLNAHINDFRYVGSELYNAKDWDGAYKAWDYYCRLATTPGEAAQAVPHSLLGEMRYYQGIAAWQKGAPADAVTLFATARSLGYDAKETYDFALICLSTLGEEQPIVDLAREAYEKYGTDDPQYIRILINDHINKNRLDSARILLVKAIAVNDHDAGLQNLMGLVVEQQEGMEHALPYFMRCVELDPEHAQGLFNVGRYYYNEATLVPERNPRMARKARIKKASQLYGQALPYLEKAYKLEPANDDVRNALRNIYYHLGDAAKLQALEKSDNP
ncbi:MAG TPA: hypothetical protein DCQ56_07385 [Porphyromonadaceae bacterium]|nr:hypothetical protein [Porphyromonadaceae bacterium]